MVGYYNQGVPTSVELENNTNQNKYTVNKSPKGGGVTLSKLTLFLMALGAILLIALAVGLTILLYPSGCETAPQALTQKSKVVATRLPTNIEPLHYRLQLIPSFQNFTTNGAVSISLNVIEDTNKISISMYDITVQNDSIKVKPSNQSEYIEITDQKYDNISQIYTIYLKEDLKKDESYELEIKFTGQLNDQMQGFYRSNYIDPKSNTTKWMASTQFSPTDARRAFPCFDEPSFKSRFTISMARPNNMTSISNMPKRATDTMVEKANWEWDHYLETPPMSSYLVAFVVSDLQAYRYNSSGKLFTVWTRMRSVDQTRLAIDVGPKLLHYFENYFNIKFPLPKIDLVAVPDFGFNGMENWGLITFREAALLYDEKTGTIESMRLVLRVLAHELGHQWFGNLVTPKWWDDLWLKEGFSNYLVYVGIPHVLPEWNFDQEYLAEEVHTAFAIDCLKSSRPISFDVVSTEDIRQSFDSLSYSKGASVIRMLEHIIGKDNFKLGLVKYLNNHKYGNAHRDDLWEALTPQAEGVELEASIKEIMDTWTRQAGFPVITASRNYTTGEVYASQKRFLLSSRKVDDKTLWWVPISYTSDIQQQQDDTSPKVWLKNTPESITFKLDAHKWWLLNVFQTGYYIVNYDEHNWKALVDHIMGLQPLTRVQILSDSMRLARANLLDYDIPLRMLTNIGVRDSEFSFIVHWTAFDNVHYLYNMLISTPAYKKFEDFLYRIFERAFNKFNFNDDPADSYSVQRLRRIILEWACKRSQSECANKAQVLFREWIKYPNQAIIRPNIQDVVLCTAIREGDETEWNLVYHHYTKTSSIEEKNRILDALGCSQKPWILSRYLDFLLKNDTGIRKQDAPRIFRSVANNPLGYTLAFNYMRTNWDKINDHFGPAFGMVSKMVGELSRFMNTPYQLAELEDFKDKNKDNLRTSEQTLNRVIEIVKGNVEWMDHSYSSIEKWLNDHMNHYGLRK